MNIERPPRDAARPGPIKPDARSALMHAVLDGTADADEVRALDALLASDAEAATEFAAWKSMFGTLAAIPMAHPPEGLVAAISSAVDAQARGASKNNSQSHQLLSSPSVLASGRTQTTRLPSGFRAFFRRPNGPVSTKELGQMNASRKIWAGGAVAVLALGVVFFATGYPPKSEDLTGTVVPAERYRAASTDTEVIRPKDTTTEVIRPKDIGTEVIRPKDITADAASADAARSAKMSDAQMKAENADASRIPRKSDAEMKAENADVSRIPRKSDAQMKAENADASRIARQSDAQMKADNADAGKSAKLTDAQLQAQNADASRIARNADAQMKADKAAQMTADKTAQMKADKAAQLQAEKAAQLQADKAAQMKADKAAQMQAEKAAQKATN